MLHPASLTATTHQTDCADVLPCCLLSGGHRRWSPAWWRSAKASQRLLEPEWCCGRASGCGGMRRSIRWWVGVCSQRWFISSACVRSESERGKPIVRMSGCVRGARRALSLTTQRDCQTSAKEGLESRLAGSSRCLAQTARLTHRSISQAHDAGVNRSASSGQPCRSTASGCARCGAGAPGSPSLLEHRAPPLATRVVSGQQQQARGVASRPQAAMRARGAQRPPGASRRPADPGMHRGRCAGSGRQQLPGTAGGPAGAAGVVLPPCSLKPHPMEDNSWDSGGLERS
jgi:hypothetical protein